MKSKPTLFPDTQRQDRALRPRSAWWRWRGRLVLILACALGCGLLAVTLARMAGTAGSINRSRLSIARVERGLFTQDVAADGQVIASVSPTLYAVAGGTVTLKAHPGDAVLRGQVVAIIDSPELTARLSQEEATLASQRNDWERARLEAERSLRQAKTAYEQAQVDEGTAQRELDRSRKAYEAGAYAEVQMLRAQDELQKASFAQQKARENYDSQPAQNRIAIDGAHDLFTRQQVQVDDLRRQVDSLSVRSPVDGQVGQVLVADRASVTHDTPLLSVVDLSALQVQIKVAEYLARELKPGMHADLEGQGRHLSGTLSSLSPEVVAGQVAARVTFDAGTPAGLRQSERLSVTVLIERRSDVLYVERGPFVEQDGGYVYLVHGNVAERHKVRLGAVSVSQVEILDGLAPGDQIVTSGSEAFQSAPRVVLSP